jgi:signal transduction histidine kinase
LSDLERTNEELRTANDDLRKRNKQIESFHHTLSHELRTPLAAVREFVSLVLDGIAGDTTEDQDRYLEIACESCDQIGMLLDDILDASRLDTGKLRINPSPNSISPVVDRVIAGMESRAEAAGVVLRTFVSDDVPQVTVDEARLAQVMGNLISNAVKFTQPGGTVEVHTHATGHSDMLTIEVRDKGCGIPPEHASHIFERLYQVPGAAPRDGGGLGLGLAICKQIVELHGGKMSVTSEPGVGSSFFFTLPITQRETTIV